MIRLSVILIVCCLQAVLQASAQTNLPPWSPPPPPLPDGMTWEEWQASQTNTVQLAGQPYWIGEDGTTNYVKVYPFLLVTGVDTNGKSILVAPPDWMLKKPEADPRYVVKAMAELGSEVVEVEIRITGQQGFFQAGLEVDP